MTMVGALSIKDSTPDNASQMYVEKAIKIAEKYPALFDYKDPVEALSSFRLVEGPRTSRTVPPVRAVRFGGEHRDTAH